MASVRWVGFDMDECIGSVMPLFYFVESIDIADMIRAADVLIDSEESGSTWLIRPAMKEVLRLLGGAYFAKQIQGAFLLSNNGSELLVNFIAVLFNRWIRRIFLLSEEPMMFVMGVSASSSVRLALGAEMSYVKSFDVVQHCLGSYGFPPCSSPSDLLFFDDQPHVLAGEIPHYCRVRAYHNQTPVWRVQKALGMFVPESVATVAAEAAHQADERDAIHRIARLTAPHLPFAVSAFAAGGGVALPFPATAEETEGDTRLMVNACLKFLAPRGGARRARSASATATASATASSRKKRRRRLSGY